MELEVIVTVNDGGDVERRLADTVIASYQFGIY